MPFKKLSRRTFLTASSALAFLHTPFARAIPARQSVNINDYNPHDWIASFKQAFSEGQTVVVPAGLVCDNINTASSFLQVKRYTSLEACAATAEGDLSYRTAAR